MLWAMTFGLLCVFVILVFWRPQEWLMPALYGWNILDGVFVLALISALAEGRERRLDFRNVPQMNLLAGLWIAAVMSHVVQTYFAGMMATVAPVAKICIFAGLLMFAMDSPRRLQIMAGLIVFMSCVMAVHALLQIHRGYGFGGQYPMYVPAYGDTEEHLRTLFFGIFEDPNDLCQMLAVSVPLSFAVFARRSLFSTLASVGISYLLVLAVLTTHSRGGYVALAVGVAFMTALLLPARWFPVVTLAGALATLLLCTMAAPFLDMAAHDRVDFWGEANYAFKAHPMFGVGFGMFPDYVSGSRAAHNAFVLCYTELGLVGYWFWFGLLFLGFLGCWRARVMLRNATTPGQRYLHRFSGLCLAAMASFCASSYFLTRAFVYPMFLLFALLNAVPLVADRFLPRGHPPLIAVKRDLYLLNTIISFGSVLYIYFTILLLNKAYYG